MNTDSISRMLWELRPAEAARVEDWFSPREREALLREIMSVARPVSHGVRGRTARQQRRRGQHVATRRLLLPVATAVGIAVAVAVLVLKSAAPPPAQAAVSFRNAGDGTIVATITNPFVAEKQLDAAFAAHGLHIEVSLVPASPSLVGTVVYSSDSGGSNSIQTLQSGRCVTGGGACPIGLKIPTGFTGQGYITLGRPAKAGESYDSTTSSFAPGETLHCSGLFGAKVSSAASVLQSRGLTVAQWRVANQVVSSAPTSNYIWQIDPVTATTVRIWTETTPPPAAGVPTAYNAGCSK